jgi:DNA (cytosine-5)-methyltransferase 1
MKLLDLFSGIGGFSLAASWAEIETVAFCEKDKYCQAVLKKHWPDIPIMDDIFKLRGDEFGTIDIISGGFPCQPFSTAGKRKGTTDDRYLWPEMLRVIETARPTWVLGENVPGIIDLALDNVLSDVEGIGYETQTFIIPACAIDAPHRRDRIWIVAYSGSRRWKVSEILCAGKSIIGNSGANVANSKRITERTGLCPNESQRIRSRRFSNCGGEGKSWPIEPRVGRVANGIPKRVDRLKGLGNAIVPELAYLFFKFMEESNAEN